MFIGMKIDQSGLQYDQIVELAQLGERLGFDAISVDDRLRSPHNRNELFIEAWSLLAGIALKTKRAKILTLATNNLIRHPGVLAKVAASVDWMSHGRLILGMGPGWEDWEENNESPISSPSIPSLNTRIEMLDESLQVVLKLWSEEKTSFKGKYYNLENAESLPKPYQNPRPPVLVELRSEEKESLLKVAAKYANIIDLPVSYFTSEENSRSILALLEEFCKTYGRGSSQIMKTTSVNCLISTSAEGLKKVVAQASNDLSIERAEYEGHLRGEGVLGLPEDVLEKMRAYERLGIDGFFIKFPRTLQAMSAECFSDCVLRRMTDNNRKRE